MIPPGRLLAACLCAALALGAGAARAADLDIAFIGGTTGAKAHVALDQLDGFRLGIRHLGGRLGGLEYALSVADDGHDTARAKRAADAAWNNGRVQVLLLSSTADAAAYVAAQAQAHRTLVLGLGDAPAALAGRSCEPYFFSLVPRRDTLQELAGAYLQGQGHHRVAVFEPPGRAEPVDAFRRGFKGEVVEIVSRRGTMDFSPDLRALSRAGADAAYLVQSGGMAVELVLQYAKAGFKAKLPLYAPASTFDETTLAASAPAAAGLVSVAPWSDDLDSPANRRLTADFETDYGRPVSMNAAAGYDAAMLLDAAIHLLNGKIGDPEAFRQALRKVDFPSARGAMRFDNDQFPLLAYWVREATEGPRGRLVNEQRGLMQKDVRDAQAGECPMPPPPPPPQPKR